jgi:hypothetical protein
MLVILPSIPFHLRILFSFDRLYSTASHTMAVIIPGRMGFRMGREWLGWEEQDSEANIRLGNVMYRFQAMVLRLLSGSRLTSPTSFR